MFRCFGKRRDCLVTFAIIGIASVPQAAQAWFRKERVVSAVAALSLILLLVGCAHLQRFVPVGNDPWTALDTKTGRTCDTRPPVEGRTLSMLPFCYDLYKGG